MVSHMYQLDCQILSSFRVGCVIDTFIFRAQVCLKPDENPKLGLDRVQAGNVSKRVQFRQQLFDAIHTSIIYDRPRIFYCGTIKTARKNAHSNKRTQPLATIVTSTMVIYDRVINPSVENNSALWAFLQHADQINSGARQVNETCRNFTCPAGSLKCGAYGCQSGSNICDMVNDCPNGQDEAPENCKNVTCPEGKFKCGDYGCLHNYHRCNGRKDCPNGEDELICQG